MDRVTLAFLLTLFAGLATGIGSLIAFFAKTTSRRFLSVALGFSAGVMIYISLVEIMPTATRGLHDALGPLSICGLVAGMAVMAVSLVLFQ